MVKHTFFDKCCTIYKDSKSNTGLNPVAELNYGDTISRVLLHFDVESLKELYDDKTISDPSKVKHILKMTNCGSVNNDVHNDVLYTPAGQKKERATSFDVLLLKVPKFWDGGKGVDFKSDFWITNNHIYSDSGCNWFQRINGGSWFEEGVYTTESLYKELESYNNGEKSNIVAEQHFDIGNENFEFDITDYVNKLIEDKEKNNGLLLCFHPDVENLLLENDQYVGFFGPYTNTFFHPYLETVYNNPINDNRNDFHMGKVNRLYLYCHDENEYFNLDTIPTCMVDGIDEEIVVKQQGKGIYYAEFPIKKGSVEEDTILYDTWSNLVLNGEKIEDQEFEFVVKKDKDRFSNRKKENGSYIPSLTGIIPDENIEVGEIRELELVFRKKFTTNVCEIFDNCYYRLYVKDASNQIDVIEWHPIDKMCLTNNILINSGDLVPNVYYIDIKRGNDYYREILRFTVKSNIDNKYI